MSDSLSRPLDLDSFVCFGVYALNNAFGRLYQGLLQELGLTYPQYLVIAVLAEKDGRSVGEIGERLSLESNTLTPLIKRLEAMSLVTRRRSKTDERQVIVSLTPQGRTLTEKAKKIPACVAAAAVTPPEDLAALRRALDELRRHLDQARS
jgi:DNA-binding MarR family transcriptional regulator